MEEGLSTGASDWAPLQMEESCFVVQVQGHAELQRWTECLVAARGGRAHPAYSLTRMPLSDPPTFPTTQQGDDITVLGWYAIVAPSAYAEM